LLKRRLSKRLDSKTAYLEAGQWVFKEPVINGEGVTPYAKPVETPSHQFDG
jgi:hypothetical protein